MATKKKAVRKSPVKKASAQADGDEETPTTGQKDGKGPASGHGVASDTPEGTYDSYEALPDYYRSFAHEGAESYAVVPHEREDEAIREGLTGRWENARDGNFVVSVMPDEQSDEDEEGDEDEDEDEG